LDETTLDAKIWKEDSQDLHDLAEMIVNRHAKITWIVVDASCTMQAQLLIDNSYYG
jgi:hypothetical protein